MYKLKYTKEFERDLKKLSAAEQKRLILRAAILEKLVQTGFVQRNGRQITPTKNGILLVSVLPDTLISAQLTAEWENQLSLISKGESSQNVEIP